MDLEKLKEIQKKAVRLKKEVHHAKKTDYAQGLIPYIDLLPVLLSSLMTTSYSKHLFFALTAVSIDINKEKSVAGFVSSDFEKFNHLCIEGICNSSLPHVGEVEREFFKKLLSSSWIVLFGTLFVAYDGAINEFKEENDGALRAGQAEFFVELMLKAFFASEFAKTTFNEMSAAISGNDNDNFASIALETLTMIALVVAFSKEDTIRATELIADLKDRLLKNFDLIDVALNSYEKQERVKREDLQPIRLFLGLEKNDLKQNQYDKFLKNLQELAKAYEINLSRLMEDIQASRKMFARALNIEEKSESKETVITFVG